MMWSRTLFLHPVSSSTYFRPEELTSIETTSQHWGTTLKYNANFEHCFTVHTQQTRFQNRNNQIKSKQPATMMRKRNITYAFNTQQNSRTETASHNGNKQPALRQHTTPQCKVGHWVSAFCLSLPKHGRFLIQVSIPKQPLHHDGCFGIHNWNNHPESKFPANIDATHHTMMQLPKAAFYCIQLTVKHISEPKQPARIETIIQHWRNTPTNGVHSNTAFTSNTQLRMLQTWRASQNRQLALMQHTPT